MQTDLFGNLGIGSFHFAVTFIDGKRDIRVFHFRSGMFTFGNNAVKNLSFGGGQGKCSIAIIQSATEYEFISLGRSVAVLTGRLFERRVAPLSSNGAKWMENFTASTVASPLREPF